MTTPLSCKPGDSNYVKGVFGGDECCTATTENGITRKICEVEGDKELRTTETNEKGQEIKSTYTDPRYPDRGIDNLFEYDDSGNLTRKTSIDKGNHYIANITTDVYTYDAHNRLIQEISKTGFDSSRPADTLNFDFSYRYDEKGRITQETKVFYAFNISNKGSVEEKQIVAHQYSSKGRLVQTDLEITKGSATERYVRNFPEKLPPLVQQLLSSDIPEATIYDTFARYQVAGLNHHGTAIYEWGTAIYSGKIVYWVDSMSSGAECEEVELAGPRFDATTIRGAVALGFENWSGPKGGLLVGVCEASSRSLSRIPNITNVKQLGTDPAPWILQLKK